MPSGFSIVMRSKEAATYRHCRYQSMQENKDMRLDKIFKSFQTDQTPDRS